MLTEHPTGFSATLQKCGITLMKALFLITFKRRIVVASIMSFFKTSFMKTSAIYLNAMQFSLLDKTRDKRAFNEGFWIFQTIEENSNCSLHPLLANPLSSILNSRGNCQLLLGRLSPWKSTATLSRKKSKTAFLHQSSFMPRLFPAIYTFFTKQTKMCNSRKMIAFISNMQKAITSFCVEVQRICIDGFVTKVKSIPYCQMVQPTSKLMMHLAFNTLVTERTVMNLPDLNFRAWTCKSMAWKSHLQGCQSATLALFLLVQKTALFSCLKLYCLWIWESINS